MTPGRRSAGLASVVLSLALAWLLAAELPAAPAAESSAPAPAPISNDAPLVLAAVHLPPPPKPEPMPQAVPAPAPEPAVAALPEAPAPEPAPEPAPPEPRPAAIEPTTVEVAEGRALLRQMEVGDGPAVEIAWPAEARAREDLYRRFVACHGMVTAVLAPDGRLYRDTGRRGEPWTMNEDRYSGFVREAAGERVLAEAHLIRAIRARHGLAGGVAVRLFPRAVDATMLGGLRRLVGGAFDEAGTVHARYRLDGRKVAVADVSVDGAAKLGFVRVACR